MSFYPAIEPSTKDKRLDFFEQRKRKRRERVAEQQEGEGEGEAPDAHGEVEEEGKDQSGEEVQGRSARNHENGKTVVKKGKKDSGQMKRMLINSLPDLKMQ